MAKQGLETRNIAVTGIGSTGRTTIQLEPEAWALVDAVASARGQHWRDWVEHEAAMNTTDASRAAWIRTRAMALFYELATRDQLQERADAIASGDPFSNPDLDGILGFLEEDHIAERLAECPVEGSTDLGGFVLHVGFDEFNRRCFWIENQMKGCPSVVISIPAPGAR